MDKKNNTLHDRCSVNTNTKEDDFVGIQKSENLYRITFPLGYRICSNEKELRKDILNLISVLSKHSDKKNSEFYNGKKSTENTNMPVQAYLYVLKEYLEYGYYKETETVFKTAKKGKINWSRTIKTRKPVVQDNEVIYLDFVIKSNSQNNDELISHIHKYCVYESFEKFGWLFTSYIPPKLKLNLSLKVMISVVKDKLSTAFNDRKRQLLENMLMILKQEEGSSGSDFRYGTNDFEYVWESLIQKTFGIENKSDYFPNTRWKLPNKEDFVNDPLKPDTIMIHNEKIYILDAKYYKYGYTANPVHLPESTSINKQITYGEYIAESEQFAKDGKHPVVYNAFIMPFDSESTRFAADDIIHYAGTASGDWKKGDKSYENIVGILLDVKYLMHLDSRLDNDGIIKLANMIEKNVRIE